MNAHPQLETIHRRRATCRREGVRRLADVSGTTPARRGVRAAGAGSPWRRGAGVDDPVPPMSPGDEAPEGTPGTGENLCPHCNGSGHEAEGRPCPVCEGTGKVITGIGGA